MKAITSRLEFSRRDFLSRGSIFALLAGASLGTTALPVNAQTKSKAMPIDRRIDGIWSKYGNMRVINIEQKGKTVTLPFAFCTPDDRAAIDLTSRMPTIRFGKDKTRILLTPKGISFGEGDKEIPWSKQSIKQLLDRLKDKQLSRDALALRLAVYATYPEYMAYKKSQSPKKFFEQRLKISKKLKEFGKKPSSQQCKIEDVLEDVQKEVIEYVDDILTAAEQLAKCVDACYDQYLKGDKDDWWGYGVCDANCLLQSFEDVVVGTIEVVTTITEPVVHQVLRCTLDNIPKGFFPNPFDLGFDIPPFAGITGPPTAGASQFSPKDLSVATDVITKMVESLPEAIKCIVDGQWDLTKLSDVKVSVKGLESVPLGITVCMDHKCAMTLLGAGLGKDAFSIISKLSELATTATVAQAVAAAGVAATSVGVVTQLVTAILVVLIVLMVHLMIVAGEIKLLDSLGLIANGICLTHPTVPIAVIGAINPLAGLLALANVPLIVTPR